MPVLKDTPIENGKRGRNPSVRAEATKEAVAGSINSWLTSYIHSLPQWIDDITKDFGDDLYERMKADPQVRSDLNTIKFTVTNGGLNSSLPVGEEDKEYNLAVEIKLFCDYTTTNLKKPFLTKTARNMLDALAFGNKVAEKVYRLPEERELAAFPKLKERGTALFLDRMKVKPRRSVAFVVDGYMNVLGLAAAQPGVRYTSTVASQALKPEDLLPLSKFAILTFGEADEDPRGQSILRTAYNAWWMKMQTWGEYLAYLTRFASPSIALFMPEDAQTYKQLNEDNVEEEIDPWTQAETALQALKGGSYGIFSFGSTLQPIEMSGEGGAFTTAIDLFNREISKAILLQTLATMEGKHQARAASSTHENVLDMVIGYVKTALEEFIKDQIWKPAIEINYGPEFLHLCPNPSLGTDSPSDNKDMYAAVAALEKAGYFTPEQKQWIDANILSIPPRASEDVEEEKKRRAAMPLPGEAPKDEDEEDDDDEERE